MEYRIAMSWHYAIFTFRSGLMRTNAVGFRQDMEIFSPRDSWSGRKGWSVSLLATSYWVEYLCTGHL